MSQPILKAGLCQAASDAIRHIQLDTSRLGQTIGTAKASAGTHAADGTEDGRPYCAAVDLRIRDLMDSDAKLKELLGRLGGAGFAAFYRHPGHDHWPATELPHFHCVFAGVAMKAALREQVHDWLATPMKNGLASHVAYTYWQPDAHMKNIVRTLFLTHNPMNG